MFEDIKHIDRTFNMYMYNGEKGEQLLEQCGISPIVTSLYNLFHFTINIPNTNIPDIQNGHMAANG